MDFRVRRRVELFPRCHLTCPSCLRLIASTIVTSLSTRSTVKIVAQLERRNTVVAAEINLQKRGERRERLSFDPHGKG